MLAITKQARRVEHVAYERHFHWRQDPGAGFGFEVRPAGGAPYGNRAPPAWSNWPRITSSTAGHRGNLPNAARIVNTSASTASNNRSEITGAPYATLRVVGHPLGGPGPRIHP